MSATQENQIDVRIRATTSEMSPAMDAAANDVEKSAERMRGAVDRLKNDMSSHMSKISDVTKSANDELANSFSAMTASFSKAGVVIAGLVVALGGYLIKAAKDTADYNEEAITLGRAMGTTATQASIWMEVAKELGSTTGEVEAASKGLTRSLREHEDRLNELGLVTRDANGELVDMDTMMKRAIETVNSFKEGTDRNMAAQEIFGRAVSGNSKLLLANAEAFKEDEEYIRSLGGQVGEEGVAAWQAYDAAMDKVGMSMTALRNVIGNEVMPVIAKLAEWFTDLMPAAITVVKGAIGGLVTAFWGLKNGVVVVWETIYAMLVSVSEPIRALTASIGKAMAGDWEGAANEIKGVTGVISNTWSQAMDNMTRSSVETADRIGAIWGDKKDVEAGEKVGASYKSAEKPEKKSAAKKSTETSRMPEWEAMLSKEKAAYMESHDMYEMSLAQEKQYWDDKLATLDKGEKEYGAVQKKSADLRLKIMKQDALESRGLTQESVDERKRIALSEIDVQQQAAEQQYALGVINYQEKLALDRQFEQERYEIARQAIEARAALMAKDPNYDKVAYQKLQDQLLEIDRKHAMDKRAIENAAQKDSMVPMMQTMQTMRQSFSQTISGMLTGAQTLRQGINSIFTNILSSFIENMVVKPLVEWAAGLMRQTALYQMFFGTKAAMEVAGTATTTATKAAEATAVVSANAAEAASGAAASVSSIPFVGWAMAAGVFASVLAMVMGAQGNIKSASGGYDIPSGINPITQLHEDEMVLPAHIANPLRSKLNGGEGDMGSMGGSGLPPIYITAMDSRDVMRAMKHGGALHKALKDYERRGVIKPA